MKAIATYSHRTACGQSRPPGRVAHRALAALLLGSAGVAAGILAPAPPALACSCVPPPPPAEAMAAADAVFRGTVVALATNDLGISATLRVRTVWKGPTALRLKIRTAIDSAACGYPFHLGDDTIVYARGDTAGIRTDLSTTSCDRTGVYDAAEATALGTPLLDRPAVDPPTPNCPRCPIPSAAGALENADVAFHGLPLRVVDSGPEGDWARHVRFRVLGVWKGVLPAEVDVVAPYLAWACRGEHWLDDDAGVLVFASRAPDGSLSVSICGRLERYDAADAASLGPVTPAPTVPASPPATVHATGSPTPAPTPTPTPGTGEPTAAASATTAARFVVRLPVAVRGVR